MTRGPDNGTPLACVCASKIDQLGPVFSWIRAFLRTFRDFCGSTRERARKGTELLPQIHIIELNLFKLVDILSALRSLALG